MDRDANRRRTVVWGSLRRGENNLVRLKQVNKSRSATYAVYECVRILDGAVSIILGET